MKLSAEQFAELASTFSAQGSPIKHDRRRANRMDLRAKIRITPIISGQRLDAYEVIACEFSARGISFLTQTPMQTGGQFITQLPRRSGGQVELLCTVMHADPVANNTHRIGAEFTCTVRPAAQQNAAQDQREMQRIRESMLK